MNRYPFVVSCVYIHSWLYLLAHSIARSAPKMYSAEDLLKTSIAAFVCK
jgi:hypothetical protein